MFQHLPTLVAYPPAPFSFSMCASEHPMYVAHAFVRAATLRSDHSKRREAQQAVHEMSENLQIPAHVFNIVSSHGHIDIVTSPERFYLRKLAGKRWVCVCCGDTPSERSKSPSRFRSTCDVCYVWPLCDRCYISDTLGGPGSCLHCFLGAAAHPVRSPRASDSSKLWVSNLRKLHAYCSQRLRMSTSIDRGVGALNGYL